MGMKNLKAGLSALLVVTTLGAPTLVRACNGAPSSVARLGAQGDNALAGENAYFSEFMKQMLDEQVLGMELEREDNYYLSLIDWVVAGQEGELPVRQPLPFCRLEDAPAIDSAEKIRQIFRDSALEVEQSVNDDYYLALVKWAVNDGGTGMKPQRQPLPFCRLEDAPTMDSQEILRRAQNDSVARITEAVEEAYVLDLANWVVSGKVGEKPLRQDVSGCKLGDFCPSVAPLETQQFIQAGESTSFISSYKNSNGERVMVKETNPPFYRSIARK